MDYSDLDPETQQFYRHALLLLKEAGVPYLVGGAYAYACYTGIIRHTKDLDLFLHVEHVDEALQVFADAGYRTEKTFPHWLAKVFSRDELIDLIYASGNGLSHVDERWFENARSSEILGVEVLLCAPEEIIWTKAFIMERERYDGADVIHLMRDCGVNIDWEHLLRLFGSDWRVLLSHLILYGYVYPSHRRDIPRSILNDLIDRLTTEEEQPPLNEEVCRGTLLSRAQYLSDVERLGFIDARKFPRGKMSESDITLWTAAIENEEE